MSESNRAVARREVKAQMGRLRLTNAALASQAKVDAKTVNNFLRDKAPRWPNNVNRSQIAQALGWPVDELDHLEREGALSPAARDVYEPASRADDLTDEELLAELVYRMRRYRNEGHDSVEMAPEVPDEPDVDEIVVEAREKLQTPTTGKKSGKRGA